MASVVLSNYPFCSPASPLICNKSSANTAKLLSISHNQHFFSTRFKKTRYCSIKDDYAITNENSSSTAETPIELKYPAFPTVMDINRIREVLPHRFPFLLLDRVIEFTPGVSAVGIKNVTINDHFFLGHFPDRPIMPGVLMIEAMAQLGAMVVLQPEVAGQHSNNFAFTGIDNLRFRRLVVPGDTLVMKMTLVKYQKRFKVGKMEGQAFVGGELVCEGVFMAVA